MLLGLGDNCIDIFVDDGAAYAGGNAVNVAVFAAALDCEAEYAGRLGADEAGRRLLREIAAAGVGVEACRVEPGEKTAWTRIGVRDGERVFLASHPGPAGPFRIDDRQRRLALRADTIHTSVYSNLPAGELAPLRRPDCRISLDGSTRPLDDFHALLPLVDLAFLSMRENNGAQAAEVIDTVTDVGPSIVVLSHGAEGATFHENGRTWRQGIVPAKVVDTLGAGDAFIARVLVGLERGELLEESGRAAAAFAAKVCERHGAFGAPLALDPADFRS